MKLSLEVKEELICEDYYERLENIGSNKLFLGGLQLCERQ